MPSDSDRHHKRIVVFCLLLAASSFLWGGCGQKGPLYLPDDPVAGGEQLEPEQLDDELVPENANPPTDPLTTF